MIIPFCATQAAVVQCADLPAYPANQSPSQAAGVCRRTTRLPCLERSQGERQVRVLTSRSGRVNRASSESRALAGHHGRLNPGHGLGARRERALDQDLHRLAVDERGDARDEYTISELGGIPGDHCLVRHLQGPFPRGLIAAGKDVMTGTETSVKDNPTGRGKYL